MVYYKITSLTSKLAKRHSDKSATLKIAYRDRFTEKEHSLPAGGTLYISSPSLPINLHKLRMKKLISVVELRKDLHDSSGVRRHFCIVKGNYLAESYKNRSYVLNFSQNLTFTPTDERVAFEDLVPQQNGRGRDPAAVARALELRAEGNTVIQIHEIMESEGFSLSESAIGNYVRGIPRG